MKIFTFEIFFNLQMAKQLMPRTLANQLEILIVLDFVHLCVLKNEQKKTINESKITKNKQ